MENPAGEAVFMGGGWRVDGLGNSSEESFSFNELYITVTGPIWGSMTLERDITKIHWADYPACIADSIVTGWFPRKGLMIGSKQVMILPADYQETGHSAWFYTANDFASPVFGKDGGGYLMMCDRGDGWYHVRDLDTDESLYVPAAEAEVGEPCFSSLEEMLAECGLYPE